MPHLAPPRAMWKWLALAVVMLAASPAGAQLTAPGATAGNAGDTHGAPRFFLTPLYSYSGLSGGRPSWQELATELLYKPNPQWLVGGVVDWSERPPQHEMRYTAEANYLPTRWIELRGRVTYTPDPEFSARQEYAAGVDWRLHASWSAVLDYRRLEYSDGPIVGYTPAVTYWFNDDGDSHVSLGYTFGRAYGQEDYHAVAVRADIGLAAGRRLRLGYAHGPDPEINPGVPGVALPVADNYSIYYRFPVDPKVDLIAGMEYEDLIDIYRRTTGSLGFSYRY